MTTWFLIGAVCALAGWIMFNIRPAPYEPQTPEFDDARLDSIRAELDVQEGKTRRVRAGA